VLAAPYVTCNVTAWAYLEEGADATTVAAAVRAALATYFDPEDANGDPNELINFGYYYRDATGTFDGQFPLSRIEGVIAAVDGVRKLGTTADGEGTLVGGFEDDVTLAIREFPAAGTLLLRNGDTGAIMYNGAI